MTNGVRDDIASATTSPKGSAHCDGNDRDVDGREEVLAGDPAGPLDEALDGLPGPDGCGPVSSRRGEPSLAREQQVVTARVGAGRSSASAGGQGDQALVDRVPAEEADPSLRGSPRAADGRVATGSTQFHSTRAPGTRGRHRLRRHQRDQGAATGHPGGDRVDAHRFLVQVHDAVAQPGGREGRHEAVAPEDAGGVRRAPRPQLADVLPAAGRQVGGREARGASRLGDALAPAAGATTCDVVAQGAQRLGEGQQHDLAAADLAVVGGQHDRGHDRPPTAR